MKPVSLALALHIFLFGQMHGAEKVSFAADFTRALAEPWGVLRGFWEVEDGVLRGTENPLETNAHHSASLRCFVPYGDAVLDYEIRFDGAKNHRLGINAAEKHRPLCFVDFQPGQLIIARESESGNPDEKAVTVARAPLALKAGEWYRVRVEFRGDALNVEIAGTKLSAKHEWIGRAKGVFKLYVSGDSASFRNLRLLTAEKEPNPAPERVPVGFLPLFDGESLKGWHTAPRLSVPATPAEAATAKTPGPTSKLQKEARGRWEVRDGVILGGQDELRAKKPTGEDWGLGSWLMTDEKFGDFELLVDARPDWPCDTGIYVRSTPLGQGFQILLDHRGDDTDGIGGSIGFLYLRGIGGLRVNPHNFRWTVGSDGLPKDVSFAPGTDGVTKMEFAASAEDFRKAWHLNDWNRFRIRVVGALPRITVWINEVKISDCDTAAIRHPNYDPAAVEQLLGKRGHIAFEVHDGPAWRWGIGKVSRWRNVHVKEL